MAETILLVEDEVTLGLITSMFLEDSGFAVALATDGLQGLEKAREHAPAVILADYMMPRMDGLAMIKALREVGVAAPAILTSAAPRVVLPEWHTDLVACFIPKPYTTDQLLPIIRKTIESRGVSA